MPVKSQRPRLSANPHAPPPASDPATERGGLLAPDGSVPWLAIRGAAQNNLRNVDVRLPLGRFVCVTGVSGSGKSSLVTDILHAALARELNGAETQPGSFECIEIEKSQNKNPSGARDSKPRSTRRGIIAPSVRESLDKIIAIDQTPIGRTPRSNPATYIKLFDEIRDLFTRLPDAKLRGYKPGRFSFNVAGGHKGGGRCEACEGNGSNRIEMDFLADVWVTCPICEGRRFTRETLQIQFKGKSIADVLDMDVQQAIEHFDNQPRIRRMLQTLHDVGLDYIKIGQPSPTLSGGEAQRIKMARELVKRATGRTMYVLDEPTTGLHFEDIRKLLVVLHSFVDAGNSVVVIEHNLDVIKTADWIIDLGPEGGAGGGLVLASGTPEEVAAGTTETGAALRAALRPNSEVRIQNSETRDSTQRSQSRVSELSIPTSEFVSVRGAAQHNLKNIDVAFPRDRMTVCTGVSGSGKTSFAIDTVYTEGHRRYVESLSAYARQFLGQLQKPKVEHVEGLSPAICIEQKAASKSPRSTVGTITEIYDYMRVLWARVGVRFCPQCQVPIGTQTVDEIVARVMALEPGAPIIVTAPVALGDGETWSHVFNRLKASGYTRVRIDGVVQETAHAVTIDARRKHRVEVVVDRTVVRAKSRSRINEAVEHALMIGNGVMTLVIEPVERVEESDGECGRPGRTSDDEANSAEGTDGLQSQITARANASDAPSANERETQVARAGETPALPAPRDILFSQKLACTKCGNSYEELSPHHYSFNSQMGWCETCEGLGVQRGAPAAAIIHKPGRTLFTGAIAGWPAINPLSPFGRTLTAICHHIGVDHKAPLNDWTPEQKQALLYGTSGDWISLSVEHRRPAGASTSHLPPHSKGKSAAGTPTLPGYRFHWRGFFPAIDNATRNSWSLRHRLHNVVTDIPCITCRGGRLRADAAATRLAPRNSEARIKNSETRESAQSSPSRVSEFLIPTSELSPTLVAICQWPLTQVADYFGNLKLDATQRKIAGELLLEIRNRLQFLIDVGLEYLTLHRAAPTLSGGEAQRIRLASQIGSGLSGVLYVLDEPTIGLHPRDTRRLIAALHKLRGLGNTLLLVEHDREVIAAADGVLDFGPRAGRYGGEIVARGTPAELAKKAESQRSKAENTGRVGSAHQARACRTGDVLESNAMVGSAHPTSEVQPSTFDLQPSLTRGYLSGELAIPVPTNRRPVNVEAAAALMDGAASEALQSRIQNPKSKIRRPPRNAAGGTLALLEHPGWLVVRGARQNNLKDLTVPMPLGRFVCVTGVSGSGKSSLINDIVWPVLANKLMMANQTPGDHDALEFVGEHRRPAGADVANFVGGTDPLPHQEDGPLALRSKIQNSKSKIESNARTGETPMLPALHRSETPFIDKVINVDQSPLGATPSSNPATYTGAFDLIRELFARLPDSKLRGYNANRFSFNRPGGRCEACEGYGQKRIEMHFMPDVWVECEICRGKRYEPETLQVRFKEKTIADVLEMRVAEAVELFDNVPKVRRLLQRLADVGLDYVQLGQPAPTLSGGEAQRVKLASELGKPDTGRTLYILDEPTTGLHFEDVRKLLEVLQNLVDLGNSVICVEHNLDVLKCADWIIDLGPEAGAAGGNVVAMGTPEQLTNAIRSRVGSAHQSSARGTAAHLGKSGAIGAGAGVVGNPTLVGGAHPTTASHTAVALAPVLAAGPFADRPVYDRHAHLAREAAIDKAGLGKVGKEIKQPWQIDGKKWHLSQRTSRDGKPRQWQPQALEFVIDLVQQAGEFAPTNWNDRASIEITASGAKTWFLHALTGGEWLIELYFMTPSGTFDAVSLNRKLGLKTLDEREDIQSYGNWPRVDVRPRYNGLDAIAIYVHDKAEIDTPTFRAFIKHAATAYGKIE